MKSKKKDVIETSGVIVKESGNGYFNVELNRTRRASVSVPRFRGRLITRKIHLLVGDSVTVELSPYDLGRGRITLRMK